MAGQRLPYSRGSGARAVCALIWLLIASPALAIDTRWIWTNSGTWTTAAAWDNGEPVNETFNAFIDGSSSVTVTLTVQRTVGSLSIGAGNRLQMHTPSFSPTTTLTSVNGIVNAGTILLADHLGSSTTLAAGGGGLTNTSTGLLHFAGGPSITSHKFIGDFVNHGSVLVERLTRFDKEGGVYSNYGDFTLHDRLIIGGGTLEHHEGQLTLNDVPGYFTLTLNEGSSLNLSGGSTFVGGRLSLSAASSVNLTAGATLVMESASSSAIVGGTFGQYGGVFDYRSGTFSDITFKYFGGTISGVPLLRNSAVVIGADATAAAEFELEGNSSLSLEGGILSAGQTLTVRHTTTGTQGLTAASGFTNDGSLLVTGTSSGTTRLAITSGTLTNGASGSLHFQSGGTGTRTFVGDLANHGTVEVDQSTTFTKPGGVYSNSGQFRVANSRILTITGNPTFEQINGTLDVLGAFNFSLGTFRYLGGTVNGVPTLFSCTFEIGANVTNPLRFVLSGNTNLILTDDVLRQDQVLDARDGELSTANGFTNHGSILLTATGSASATLRVADGFLVVSPSGILHFQAGGGSRTLIGDLTNHGVVQIDGSTSFAKTGGTATNYAQFSIAPFRTLTILNGGTFTQAGGTLNIAGTLNVMSSSFQYFGGTISGVPVLTSGILEIGPSAIGPASFVLEGNSTLLGDVHLGQTLTVRPTGTVGIQSLTSPNGLTNSGSILVAGTSIWTTRLTITDGTLINNATGLLHFQAGGTASRTFTGNLTNHGTVLVDRNTTFNAPAGAYANHGQFTIASSQSLTISGGATFEQIGGTLNVSGTFALNNGTFQYRGGTINGEIPLIQGTLAIGPGAVNPAQFRLQGNTTLILDDNILREGQVLTLRPDSLINQTTLNSATGFVNQGSIVFSIESSFSAPARLVIAEGALENGETGLVHFQAPAFSAYFRHFTADLINDGTVLVATGAFFDKSDGRYINRGQFTVTGFVNIVNGGVFEQAKGTTLVNGTVTSATPLSFLGGRLTGRGTISAAVENVEATVEPGAGVGRLTIEGDYAQQPSGMLDIELAGTGSNQFDVLSVTGSAALSGTLRVNLLNNFTPVIGQAFSFLTAAGGIVGTFDAELLPPLPGDVSWNVIYGSNSVTLSVGLPGDFNGDGVTDAADYVLWRKGLGSSHSPSDYEHWRASFGQVTTSGSSGGQPSPLSTAVPEPGAGVLLMVGVVGLFLARRRMAL